MSETTDENKEIISYIGIERYKLIRSLSPEEARVLTSSGVSTEGSILVEGSEKSLRKFKAYYLTLCAGERPAHAEYSVAEYTSAMMNKEDEPVGFMSSSLVFIYCHREPFGTGKAEGWMETKLLSVAVERKRAKKLTVILSERTLPILQKSEEIQYVDLRTPFKENKTTTKVILPVESTSISTSPTPTSSSTGSDFNPYD